MDYTKLKTELADPKYASLVASGNDQGCADMLNAVDPTITVNQVANCLDIIDVLLATGDYAKVAAALDANAKLSLALLNDPRRLTIDLSLPIIQADMAAMVANGDLLQATMVAINSLGQINGSRAQQLGLGPVSNVDIAKALRG